MIDTFTAGLLRREFVRLLTEDSETKDRRKRDYNQAIFMSDGNAVFTSTDLDMVLAKYDRAVWLLRHR